MNGPTSPRTSLQRELTAFSYEVVDLVLNIYDTNLEAIREQFQRHGGQLTAEEFVETVMDLLGPNAEVKVRVPQGCQDASLNKLDESTQVTDEGLPGSLSTRYGTATQDSFTVRPRSSQSGRTGSRPLGKSSQRQNQARVPTPGATFNRQVLDEGILRFRLMALFAELDATKRGVVTWNQYATFCMNLSEVVVDPQVTHGLEAYQKFNPRDEEAEEVRIESDTSSEEEEPATKQAQLTKRLQEIFSNYDTSTDPEKNLSSQEFGHLVEKKVEESLRNPDKKKREKQFRRRAVAQARTQKEPASKVKVRSQIELIQYVPPIDAIAKVESKGTGVELLRADNLDYLGSLSDRPASSMVGEQETNMVEAMEWFMSTGSYARPYMLTASANSTITLWNIHPGKQMGTKITSWPTGSSQQCMRFIDRYKVLYSGSSMGTVHSWNVRQACELSSIQLHDDIVTKMVDIPSQDAIATASHDKTSKVFDLSTGVELLKFVGHRRGIVDIDYLHERRVLLTASYDHECGVYSPLTPSRIHTLRGHDMPLLAARGVPESSEVLTASIDGKVKIWDLRQPSRPIYDVDASEDDSASNSGRSKSFLCGFDICHPAHPQFMCAFKDIHLYRRIENKEMKHKAHTQGVASVGCDGKHGSILTAVDKSVSTWSVLTGKLQREFRDVAKSTISCMLVDSNSGLFYLGLENGDIQLHGTLTGHKLHQLVGHRDEVVALEFFGTDVVSAGKDRKIMLHRTFDAIHKQRIPRAEVVTSGAGSAQMLSASSDKGGIDSLLASHMPNYRRRSIIQGDEMPPPQTPGQEEHSQNNGPVWGIGHSKETTCIDCSAREGLIASGGKDNMIFVWQAETGQLIAKQGLHSPLSRVRFLPGESILVSSDEGGDVIFWKINQTSFTINPMCAFHHNPTSFASGFTKEDVTNLLIECNKQDDRRKSKGDLGIEASNLSGESSSDLHLHTSGFEKRSSSDSDSSEFQQPAVITSITYDSTCNRLYTGDDEGRISCWNLTSLFQAFEEFEIGEMKQIGGTRQVRRRHSLSLEDDDRESMLRYTYNTNAVNFSLHSAHFLDQKLNDLKQRWFSIRANLPSDLVPLVCPHGLIKRQWNVVAHEESVQQLFYTDIPGIPETIISGSFDGHVMATRKSDGQLVGKLVGLIHESRNPSWNIEVDIDKLRSYFNLDTFGENFAHSADSSALKRFGYTQPLEETSEAGSKDADTSDEDEMRILHDPKSYPEPPIDDSLRFSKQNLCSSETQKRASSALTQLHEMLNAAQ